MNDQLQEHKASLNEEDLSDIARVGKRMGDAIAHDLESPEEAFADIKDAAEDVKNVFTKLRDTMDHNDFAEVTEKAERLGKLLEHNEIIGREVKTVSKVAVDLAMDIVAIVGAAATGNYGAIPAATSNAAIDLAYAGKLMVPGVAARVVRGRRQAACGIALAPVRLALHLRAMAGGTVLDVHRLPRRQDGRIIDGQAHATGRTLLPASGEQGGVAHGHPQAARLFHGGDPNMAGCQEDISRRARSCLRNAHCVQTQCRRGPPRLVTCLSTGFSTEPVGILLPLVAASR